MQKSKTIKLLCIFLVFFFMTSGMAMAGLKEKRAIKDFQDNDFAGLKKKIDEAAKFEVNLEVDWNNLAIKDRSHLYKEGFTKIFFNSTTEAFKKLCADEMGSKALKASLKKIVFTNSGQYYSEKGISFKDGVLTIDHKPDTNMDGFRHKDRVEGIVKVLEDAL